MTDTPTDTVPQLTFAELVEADRAQRAESDRAWARARAATETARNDAERTAKAVQMEIATKYPDGLAYAALTAYDNARSALATLYAEARRLNDSLQRIDGRLKKAGAGRSTAAQVDMPEDRVYSSHDSDGRLVAVVIGEDSFQISNPSNWVRTAVCEVAHSNGGMPLPYSENLYQRTKGQTPALLEDHRRAGRHG
jgi:hypothetical protein